MLIPACLPFLHQERVETLSANSSASPTNYAAVEAKLLQAVAKLKELIPAHKTLQQQHSDATAKLADTEARAAQLEEQVVSLQTRHGAQMHSVTSEAAALRKQVSDMQALHAAASASGAPEQLLPDVINPVAAVAPSHPKVMRQLIRNSVPLARLFKLYSDVSVTLHTQAFPGHCFHSRRFLQ